jgi:hypothetical protein
MGSFVVYHPVTVTGGKTELCSRLDTRTSMRVCACTRGLATLLSACRGDGLIVIDEVVKSDKLES